jgi:hypothetical protein
MEMVIIKASSLDAGFRRKSSMAKYSIICCFLRANNLVIRSKTHQAQKSRTLMEEEGKQFLASIIPRLQESGRDQRYILNMDQTAIYFSMTPKTTLNTRGAKTVSVRTSSDSTKRISVAVTVTASGLKLPPMMIFNAQPNGRIERELSKFPNGAVYAVQKNAWMDERVMLLWVDRVLAPYVQKAPEGMRPIIFLDSYRCHMMASVVQKVQELGVEVQHIPGGCTGVCQPVDVGIGKPLKNRITNCWEKWMVESGGLEEKKTKTPSRETLSEWIIESMNSLDEQIVQNSWRHRGFSYFPNENTSENANDNTVNDDENNNEINEEDDEDEILFESEFVFGNNKSIIVSSPNLDSMASDDDETSSSTTENSGDDEESE